MHFAHHHYPGFSVLVFVMAIGAGCSATDFDADGFFLFEGPSTSVATIDIDATMSARATESAMTRIVVELDEDGVLLGNDLFLSGGERLEATFGAQTQTLARDPASTDIEYFADFNSSSSVDPIQVRFFRRDGSIVDSPFVFLRPDFTVTSPSTGQAADFMDVLSLEWTPAEPAEIMDVRLRLLCMTLDGGSRLRNVFQNFTDDGSASYDLSLFPEATDPLIDQSIDCILEIEFTRETLSSVAPPFGDGSFFTVQSRTIENIVVSF